MLKLLSPHPNLRQHKVFTGIIQAIGKVVKYDGNRLWIAAPVRSKGMARGESISVGRSLFDRGLSKGDATVGRKL